MAEQMCGGTTGVREADDDIKEICRQVKSEVEAKEGPFAEFEPTHYMTQLVAGTNYFIKVRVGDGKYIHLRIYQTLPHAGSTLEVSNILKGKAEADTLEYF